MSRDVCVCVCGDRQLVDGLNAQFSRGAHISNLGKILLYASSTIIYSHLPALLWSSTRAKGEGSKYIHISVPLPPPLHPRMYISRVRKINVAIFLRIFSSCRSTSRSSPPFILYTYCVCLYFSSFAAPPLPLVTRPHVPISFRQPRRRSFGNTFPSRAKRHDAASVLPYHTATVLHFIRVQWAAAYVHMDIRKIAFIQYTYIIILYIILYYILHIHATHVYNKIYTYNIVYGQIIGTDRMLLCMYMYLYMWMSSV